MHCLAAGSGGELRQQKRHDKAGDVHKRHRKTAPFDAVSVSLRLCIKRMKDMSRDGGNVEQPHAKESEPGTDLYRRELSHCARHLAQCGHDFCEACADTCFFPAHAMKSIHVLG